MKLTYPKYYKEFQCIGTNCNDNCCIGWEIDIDEKTYEYYKSVDGEFGEKLNKSIMASEYPAFILGENERCPFLNENNLCDIILNLGEDKLCHICDSHPRFYNNFGDYSEVGLGLCCEQATSLMFYNKSPVIFETVDSNFEKSDDYFDVDLFNYVLTYRAEIYKILQNRKLSIENNLIKMLCSYSEQASGKINGDFKAIIDTFLTFETLDKAWFELLIDLKDNLCIVKEKEQEFKRFYSENYFHFEHLAIYFIYRYLVQSVYDEDIYSKLNFVALSVIIIKYLSINQWLKQGDFSTDDLIYIAKCYSKEIEYSDENIELIYDNCYENIAFSHSSLIEILNNNF